MVIKMYSFVNVNPCKKLLGDCVVRAISLALDQSWDKTYIDLCIEGLMQCDMPNSNAVFASYLLSKGFKKYPILDTMTFKQFAERYPNGTYVVATGSHIACIKNSTLYDNWDSSDESVSYFFAKEQ